MTVGDNSITGQCFPKQLLQFRNWDSEQIMRLWVYLNVDIIQNLGDGKPKHVKDTCYEWHRYELLLPWIALM